MEFWDRAIVELGLVFIQENASFRKENLNDVLAELALLKEWASINLLGHDLEYMKESEESQQEKGRICARNRETGGNRPFFIARIAKK